MEFRVLGPIELRIDGAARPVGAAKERCLLAALLLSPGQLISIETLLTRLWGDDPPVRARDSLYSYIARLRRRLRSVTPRAAVVADSGRYGLRVDPDDIDLHRFRRFRKQAASLIADGEDEHAALLLQEADAMWGGRPLHGVPGDWADRTRTRLLDERLDAALERAAIITRLGRPTEVLAELNEFADQHPHTETITEHLMVALQLAGRPADALRAYELTRRRLADDLGVDPGPGLQRTHQRVMRGQRATAQLRPRPRTAIITNLPREVADFTARGEELELLIRLTREMTSACVIASIEGPPGIGKTALALHAAHRIGDSHTDRIYLRLRDSDHHAIDVDTALEMLLQITGVPAHHIPSGVQARGAAWRDRLARRRVVLVLDDAASNDQVRWLLPGGPSLVIITSRRRLSGLDSAVHVPLAPLTPTQAIDLFARITGVGTGPHAPDADTIADLVRLCGYSPLAIRLVAARLLTHPSWTVAHVLHRIRDGHRLGELRADDRSVQSAIEQSDRELPAAARAALRRLSVHPTGEMSRAVAAAMVGSAPAEADRVLDTLIDNCLLDEPGTHLLRMHDLIRDYAAEACPPGEQATALAELLDFYRRVAEIAETAVTAGSGPDTAERIAARAQLRADHFVILAAARAGMSQRPAELARLAEPLATQLDRWGDFADATAIHTTAARYWERVGEPAGRARALTDLARALWRTGRLAEAQSTTRRAARLFGSADDRLGLADTADLTGLIHCHTGDFTAALGEHRRAVDAYRELGRTRRQAGALSHQGVAQSHVGANQAALTSLHAALALSTSVGDSLGRRDVLNNIGAVHALLGDFRTALDYFQQCLDLTQASGGPQAEAVLLANIGELQYDLGQYDNALDAATRAAEACQRLGDRRGFADAGNGIGNACLALGRPARALRAHEASRAVAQQIDDHHELSRSWCGLGAAHLAMGQHTDALAAYRTAAHLAADSHEPLIAAHAIEGLGRAHLAAGDLRQGRADLHRAHAFYQRLGVPDADRLSPDLSDPTRRR